MGWILLIALASPIPAEAGRIITSFQNDSGQTVTGLQAVFEVPSDTITLLDVISNPANAGQVTITHFDASTPPFNNLTRFDLTWDAPGLPTGETVVFEFGPVFNELNLFAGGSFGPFWTTQSGVQVLAPPAGPGAWTSYYVPGPPVPGPPSLLLLALGVVAASAASLWRCRPRGVQQA